MDYLRENKSISKDEIIINLIHILWENRMMPQADIVDDITEDVDFVDDRLDAKKRHPKGRNADTTTKRPILLL